MVEVKCQPPPVFEVRQNNANATKMSVGCCNEDLGALAEMGIDGASRKMISGVFSRYQWLPRGRGGQNLPGPDWSRVNATT